MTFRRWLFGYVAFVIALPPTPASAGRLPYRSLSRSIAVASSISRRRANRSCDGGVPTERSGALTRRSRMESGPAPSAGRAGMMGDAFHSHDCAAGRHSTSMASMGRRVALETREAEIRERRRALAGRLVMPAGNATRSDRGPGAWIGTDFGARLLCAATHVSVRRYRRVRLRQAWHGRIGRHIHARLSRARRRRGRSGARRRASSRARARARRLPGQQPGRMGRAARSRR